MNLSDMGLWSELPLHPEQELHLLTNWQYKTKHVLPSINVIGKLFNLTRSCNYDYGSRYYKWNNKNRWWWDDSPLISQMKYEMDRTYRKHSHYPLFTLLQCTLTQYARHANIRIYIYVSQWLIDAKHRVIVQSFLLPKCIWLCVLVYTQIGVFATMVYFARIVRIWTMDHTKVSVKLTDG
jgi:hypothetical protein